MTTRFISLAFVLCCACIPGPGGRTDTPGDTLWHEIQEKRQITACYVDYPPSVITNLSDISRPSGFLVEVTNEIARRAGLEVRYEPTTILESTAALGGRCNMVVAPVFITVERAKKIDFTRPIVFWRGVAALSRRADLEKFDSLDAVNKPGVRITVAAGTAQEEYVRRNLPRSERLTLTVEDISMTFLEVMAGRADVSFASHFLISRFVASQPEAAMLFGGKPLNDYAVAFPIPLGSVMSKAFLNNALLVLQTDGTMASLIRKYESEAQWSIQGQSHGG